MCKYPSTIEPYIDKACVNHALYPISSFMMTNKSPMPKNWHNFHPFLTGHVTQRLGYWSRKRKREYRTKDNFSRFEDWSRKLKRPRLGIDLDRIFGIAMLMDTNSNDSTCFYNIGEGSADAIFVVNSLLTYSFLEQIVNWSWFIGMIICLNFLPSKFWISRQSLCLGMIADIEEERLGRKSLKMTVVKDFNSNRLSMKHLDSVNDSCDETEGRMLAESDIIVFLGKKWRQLTPLFFNFRRVGTKNTVKTDQKYLTVTQPKMVYRGCVRVYLKHKYPTFVKMHQDSHVCILNTYWTL